MDLSARNLFDYTIMFLVLQMVLSFWPKNSFSLWESF